MEGRDGMKKEWYIFASVTIFRFELSVLCELCSVTHTKHCMLGIIHSIGEETEVRRV